MRNLNWPGFAIFVAYLFCVIILAIAVMVTLTGMGMRCLLRKFIIEPMRRRKKTPWAVPSRPSLVC